jgi:putative transposase
MRKRQWEAKTKALIVLEGLKGKPVAELCHEHQISHSQYSQWRDQFLANAANAFESHQHTRRLRVTQSDEELVPCIQALKAEHQFWGYRRIWAHLRFVQQRAVNKKRLLRLMRAQPLLVPPHLRLKAKRTPTGSKPRPTKPHEWWGIDMTKVMVAGFGWVYIVVVLDWYTEKVVGYYASVPCTAKHWLAALDMAVNHQFPEGQKHGGIFDA